MSFVTNTAANEVKGAKVEGFAVGAGTLLDLDIGAGYIDGRPVPADAAVSVTAASATFRGYIVHEDGAGSLSVTMTADDSAADAAEALAQAEALDVPAGEIAILAGAVDDTTAVGLLKSSSVKGKLPDVSADF